jgi:phosphatidylglycerol:prolipoprotein diacylglycerol transferase
MFEAFEIGPFLIWTHLVFLLIGIVLSTEFFLRLAQRAALSLQHLEEHPLQYLFVFLISGRALAIITEYRVYLKDPWRILIVWDGGFSFLGGAIGLAVLLYVVTRLQRSTFLQWLDVLVPPTTLGLTFDWLGKLFSGQAYGRPTDVAWGVTYDAMHVRYAVPIHLVQLYYAIFFLLLTFLLLVIRKHARRVGTETLVGICLMAVVTFLLEYFRGDFGIPVFAMKIDFVVLIALFVSLTVFALIELKLTERAVIVTELLLAAVFGGYLMARPWLPFPTFELRFSQLLSVLALFATVVYVIVHRRRYPHL